jgi:DNA-binding MurR/RpiR family transcriptional regulator
VQPSTIVRFAKTFGYEGASEMQKLFRDELLSMAPSPSYAERIRQFNERAGEGAAQSPSDLLHEFVDGNIAALQHLNETARQADLEHGVRLIAEADAVYLVGLRRSFPVAAYLAYALRHADKRAYLVDGLAGMIVEQSTMLGAGDLLIATSFRPYAQQTADIVEEGAKRGAKVMAISDSRLSPIARRADLCFEVKDAEFRKFRSLTASLCLAQTLVISYAFQLTARDSATKS